MESGTSARPSKLRKRTSHSAPQGASVESNSKKDHLTIFMTLFHRYKNTLGIILGLALLQLVMGYTFICSFDSLTEGFEKLWSLKQDFSGNATIFRDFNLNASCKVISKDTHSAIKRAKSMACKQKLAEVACLHESGGLYPSRLPNYCPQIRNESQGGLYLGCFRDAFDNRMLGGLVTKFNHENQKEVCQNHCSESGFSYAGLQYGVECFCGNEVPNQSKKIAESKCDKKCPGDNAQPCGGYLTMNVYQTDVITRSLEPPVEEGDIDDDEVRIVYLLTVSGRAVRQVRRLLKRIYHLNHFYLIHIDSRQDYMYRELAVLELKYPNIRIARNRHATIWGGASLLSMILDSIRELLSLSWKWDFILNLSESDYPLKPSESLVHFLSLNKERNFVKSHGRETNVFIKKQGLDRTFLECEHHMWRVGYRQLPQGIFIDGGSDWICLNRKFAQYVAQGHDQLINGLRKVFEFSLLPAESFFHVALKNSKFCSSVVNNNLHLTNWKRKQGCKCQHKAIVDWCGCSPNDIKPSDWNKITGTFKKQTYFARKFEPIVNQEVINKLDSWLLGPDFNANLSALNDYWQNIYHYLDESPKPRPEGISLAHVIAQDYFESFQLRRVLEITSFQRNDELQGILILVSVTNHRHEILSDRELFVRVTQLSSVITVHGRALEITLGTDYDPKELIFRNIMNAFSPNSKLGISYRIESGSNPVHVTFILINPVGETNMVHHKSFNASFHQDVLHPELNNPLIPGIWSILVVEGGKVQSKMRFLVTPLLENYVTNQTKLKDIHLGSQNQVFNNAHQEFNTEQIENLKKIADSNAKKLGSDLFQWVKDLATQFYEVKKVCLVQSEEHTDIPLCTNENWSSKYPDPKSTIQDIDSNKGTFI